MQATHSPAAPRPVGGPSLPAPACEDTQTKGLDQLPHSLLVCRCSRPLSSLSPPLPSPMPLQTCQQQPPPPPLPPSLHPSQALLPLMSLPQPRRKQGQKGSTSQMAPDSVSYQPVSNQTRFLKGFHRGFSFGVAQKRLLTSFLPLEGFCTAESTSALQHALTSQAH